MSILPTDRTSIAMKKYILLFTFALYFQVVCSVDTACTLSSPNEQAYSRDLLANRFILEKDEAVFQLAGISLRSTWWSRPYEYAWASHFVGADYVVLDAASGISHPFKWHLGQTCKETWALDIDPRIANINAIFQETKADLGLQALETLQKSPKLHRNVNRICGSICCLPDTLPQFDHASCVKN